MKIKDMADVISKSVAIADLPEDTRFVGLEHYVPGDVLIHRTSGIEMLKTAVKEFQAGDVLVARRNVYLKRASAVDFNGVTSGDSIVLRPKNSIYGRILPFILNMPQFWDFAEKFSDGSMSKRLAPKTLVEYEFSFSDFTNLEKLTDLLWSINDTKEAYEKLMRQTDELVKSQFVEMFGLPEDNRHGFEIGHISDVVTDVHYGTAKKASDDGAYTYIRMNNITYEGTLDLTDIKRISVPEKELPGCLVKKGDVLFNRTNSRELVGKTCAFNLEEPMIIAGYIIRLRMNGRVHPEYLSTFMNLRRSKDLLMSMAKGAVGQANINAQEVQSIELIIPPEKLQDEFDNLIRQSNKSKLELSRTLSNLENMTRTILQQEITR